MKSIGASIIIFFLFLYPSAGESLWDAGFSGYLSKNYRLAIGDVVTVTISSDFSLSYVSSSTDSKSFTLEFSGGEYPNLFSFMPIARSGNQNNLQSRENRSFKSDVVARVTSIDAAQKTAIIQGTKSILVDGKSESVTLTGTIDPADLGTDKKIDFSKVADSRLTLKTFLEPSTTILTANDIQEVIGALGTAGTSGTYAGGTPEPGATTQQSKVFSLTDAKKKELFLRYVNKIIDLIF
jgi:hypothetical protein